MMLNFIILLSSFINYETREKIVVIDTGLINPAQFKHILCAQDHLDFTTNKTGLDKNKHGTNIVGIISKNLNFNKYCILMMKYYEEKSGTNQFRVDSSLEEVLKQNKVKLVNFSSSGFGFIKTEKEFIRKITNRGIYFITAAGNTGKDTTIEPVYPSCYKIQHSKFRVVGNLNPDLSKNLTSAYGQCVNTWETGTEVCGGWDSNNQPICFTGTSQAAAVHSNKILRGLIK